MNRLNFSPKPFRTKGGPLLGLWVLNAVLIAALAIGVWHWQGLRGQNASAHGDIDALEAKQAEIAAENEDAVTWMEGVDMKTYRKQVRQFHEIQMAFGTNWGKLLDQLAVLLPDDVRMRELRPISARGRGSVRQQRIHLVAEARSKEAQLDFVSTLQEDATIQQVTFESEVYREEGIALVFEISFSYQPGGK